MLDQKTPRMSFRTIYFGSYLINIMRRNIPLNNHQFNRINHYLLSSAFIIFYYYFIFLFERNNQDFSREIFENIK